MCLQLCSKVLHKLEFDTKDQVLFLTYFYSKIIQLSWLLLCYPDTHFPPILQYLSSEEGNILTQQRKNTPLVLAWLVGLVSKPG